MAVHDVGTSDDESFLVSSLVEGHNLADLLMIRRPDVRQSAAWIAALSDALDIGHSAGITHRDVKPSNVLIDADDNVYLTDFGLAKGAAGTGTLTVSGHVMGTPAYMAPSTSTGRQQFGRCEPMSTAWA